MKLLKLLNWNYGFRDIIIKGEEKCFDNLLKKSTIRRIFKIAQEILDNWRSWGKGGEPWRVRQWEPGCSGRETKTLTFKRENLLSRVHLHIGRTLIPPPSSMTEAGVLRSTCFEPVQERVPVRACALFTLFDFTPFTLVICIFLQFFETTSFLDRAFKRDFDSIPFLEVLFHIRRIEICCCFNKIKKRNKISRNVNQYAWISNENPSSNR